MKERKLERERKQVTDKEGEKKANIARETERDREKEKEREREEYSMRKK